MQIILLKDHAGKKQGELVQIPFLDGRELVREGIAFLWDGGPIARMDIEAVPPVELKTESLKAIEITQPILGVDDAPEVDGMIGGEAEVSDAELEEMTAPKSKSKKHKG